MAAQIRRELGEEVDMLNAGRLAFLGIFLSRKTVLAAVRAGLAS